MKSTPSCVALCTHGQHPGVDIGIRTVSDKQPDEVEVSPLCGEAQRSMNHGIGFMHIGIGARIEELLSDLILAVPARIAQSGPTLSILCVNGRTRKYKIEKIAQIPCARRSHERRSIVYRIGLKGWHR
jgi:hypothetical protein